MILPFRTFDANGTTLVRTAGTFYKRVAKIFTLLTDHLIYGHHFNLSGTISRDNRTVSPVNVCTRAYMWEKSSVAPDRFRAWINDPRSLYNTFLALLQRVTARQERRGEAPWRLEFPRLSASRRDQNINHAQHPRTICPTMYPALPSHCSRSTSAAACSVLLEETQSQAGELS